MTARCEPINLLPNLENCARTAPAARAQLFGGPAIPRKPCAHPGCKRLAGPGLARCTAHEAAHQRRRQREADASRAAKPSRRWYSTAAWRARRLNQLRREPLCRRCAALGRTREAAIADHVVPHREDRRAFWEGALQSLCKPCHDGAKQREEAASPPLPFRKH
ncbi:HNH endonuclease [Rhodovulum sp. DZ06]|uniref:HNH endonuclease n=1 Tax=Rhodovulum sp. DZ06 TaxID=3425126 RepID=UPI003D350DAB